MGSKSGPPAPDYRAAAEEEAKASKENLTQQTWANRANQTTPWGSLTWGSESAVDPSTGQNVTKWTQNVDVDPRLQGAVDSQMALQTGRSQLAGGMLGRAQQEFAQPMDWTRFGSPHQGPQAGSLNPTTTPFGFGTQTPQLNAQMGQGVGGIQRGLDFGGVQDVQGSGQQRQRAEDAIYKSMTSRLDPQWEQRQRQMETQLANQGITRESGAYDRAAQQFGMDRNDAYAAAQLAAINQGGTEAQRNYGMDLGLRQQQVGEIGQQGMFGNQAQQQAFGQSLGAGQANNAALQGMFGMGMQRDAFGLGRQQQAFGQQQAAGAQNFQQQLQATQYANQLRQQQMAEEMQRRGFTLNEINAIISGQQVNTPQFQGYGQAGVAQAPQYMAAAQNQYGASLDAYNAKQGGLNSLFGAAGQLGSAFMLSDRRVKRIGKRVGTHPRGFGVYRLRYIGEAQERLGVIAQEVQRVAPELVIEHKGLLAVNYGAM